MQLKYTDSGTAYIEFDYENYLIFSPMCKDPKKGYRDLVFNGTIDTPVKVKKNAAPRIIRHRKSFITNTNLTKIPMDVRKSNPYLTSITIKYLKKVFSKVTDNEGFVDPIKLPIIEDELSTIAPSASDDVEDDENLVEEEEEEEESDLDPYDLNDMNRRELRQYIKDKNLDIKIKRNMKNDDIRQAIISAVRGN